MARIEEVLHNILHLLNKLRFPYMLVGGLAVGFFGEPRFTRDIDIAIIIDPKNIEILIRALKRHKYIFHEKEILMLSRLSNRFAIADPSDTYRIDLWIPKSGYEKKSFERRKKKKISQTSFFLISPEDLILFKLLADRPQDILDIKGILGRQKGKLDRDYMRFWAIALNKYQKLKKLEKE